MDLELGDRPEVAAGLAALGEPEVARAAAAEIAAAPAAQWAAESGKQIVSKSNQLTEACSGYVRERPLASIAGAIAIGYLIGRLMR